MSSFDFILRHYQGIKLKVWMSRTNRYGINSGHELVISLSGTDNVYGAGKLLKAAEQEGLIERVAYAPSPEVKLFGIAGTDEKHHAKLNDRDKDPTTFNWRLTSKGKEYIEREYVVG